MVGTSRPSRSQSSSVEVDAERARRSPADARPRWSSRRSRRWRGWRSRTPRASAPSRCAGPRCTISTMRRPARCASTLAARIDRRDRGVVGQADAERSRPCYAMVEAVPMVMQWPGERDMPASALMKSAERHLAGLAPSSLKLPDVGARADRRSRGTCRSASARRESDDGRQVAARRAHQQRRRGLVAADQQHDAVDRVARGSIPRHPC